MKPQPEHTSEPRLLRTTQAAQAAGVSRQTLQYYLLIGLVEPTRRTRSGQQLFDHRAVRRIQLVKQINESGYPLREIRDIFLQRGPDEPPRPPHGNGRDKH